MEHGQTKHPDLDMNQRRKTDAEKRAADRLLEVKISTHSFLVCVFIDV